MLSEKFNYKTGGFVSPENEKTVEWGDLVERGGLYYKKFTDVPFTGEVTGQRHGSFKDGKEDGPWVSYYDSGQLMSKGDLKNGKPDGPWVWYDEDGTKNEFLSGTYRNGEGERER